MKKTTAGLLLQIPLWLILLLVLVGPILPDKDGVTHPGLFILLLGVIALYVWGLVKMAKSSSSKRIKIETPPDGKQY